MNIAFEGKVNIYKIHFHHFCNCLLTHYEVNFPLLRGVILGVKISPHNRKMTKKTIHWCCVVSKVAEGAMPTSEARPIPNRKSMIFCFCGTSKDI